LLNKRGKKIRPMKQNCAEQGETAKKKTRVGSGVDEEN